MMMMEWCCAGLCGLLAAVGQDAAAEELRQVEKTLADLARLHRSLGEDGPLPDRTALTVGAATRLEVVSELDAIQAKRLGMTPERLRSWLLPGFVEELRTLSLELAGSEEAPAAPGSGVLTLLLDLEVELHREALRNLMRRGIPDPRRALGLDFKQEIEQQIAETSGSEKHEPEIPSREPAPEGNDPLLAAEAHYRKGEYVEALESYQKVDQMRNPRISPQVMYRTGECQRQLGRLSEALASFERVITDHPDSPWVPQAQWSASLVKTLQALEAAGSIRDQR